MFSELPAWSEATAGREPSLLSPSELSLSTSLSPWRAGDFEMTERGQGGPNRSVAGSEHRLHLIVYSHGRARLKSKLLAMVEPPY